MHKWRACNWVFFLLGPGSSQELVFLMALVRSGWLIFPVVEVRPDLSTARQIRWGHTTVGTVKMSVLAARELVPRAPKEPSDSKEAPQHRDVWRSATTISGARCVMTCGELQMLTWLVGSLDIKEQVGGISEQKAKIAIVYTVGLSRGVSRI